MIYLSPFHLFTFSFEIARVLGRIYCILVEQRCQEFRLVGTLSENERFKG